MFFVPFVRLIVLVPQTIYCLVSRTMVELVELDISTPRRFTAVSFIYAADWGHHS